jgi:serine/threonine protein phosphatase PrpC
VLRAPPLRLDAAGASDPGPVRDHNEDCFLADLELGLYIVADGLGGHQCGEVASRLAVDTLRQSFAGRARLAGGRRLSAALQAANDAILAASARETGLLGMGSTAVVAWLPSPRGSAWIGHVGDSRAYLWRGARLRRLTEDHTLLNQVRQAGQLPADPDDWPPRSVLSQALGISPLIAPEVSRQTLRAGDMLLLCSDGLTDTLAEDEIAGLVAAAGAAAEACAALVAEANRRASRDNITAVIIRALAPARARTARASRPAPVR